MERREDTTFSTMTKIAFKQVVKVLICFIGILSLFGILNILIVYFRNIERIITGMPYLTTVLVGVFIGIVFIVLALLFLKKYVLIDSVSIVYSYLTPFFKKLSTTIIESVYDKSIDLSKKKPFAKTIDVGVFFKDTYQSKVPKIIQKGILFLLNQIPIAEFILNIQKDDEQIENKELMSNRLYEQINFYIQDSIFKPNNLYWILWLFLLNIIVQLGAYYLLDHFWL